MFKKSISSQLIVDKNESIFSFTQVTQILTADKAECVYAVEIIKIIAQFLRKKTSPCCDKLDVPRKRQWERL